MEASSEIGDEFRAWLASGDLRRAGAWMVHRYAREVLGLCAAMTRDRNVAEDLCQEVFISAFARLTGFRGDASPRTWLLTIARNRCIDHIRARGADLRGDLRDCDPDFEAYKGPLPNDLLAQRDEILRALDCLAEAERALVVLRFREGLSHAEIANAFGLREGTIRMRLSRALSAMRAGLVRGGLNSTATDSRVPSRTEPQRPAFGPGPQKLWCPGYDHPESAPQRPSHALHVPRHVQREPSRPGRTANRDLTMDLPGNVSSLTRALAGRLPMPGAALVAALERIVDGLEATSARHA